MINESQPVKNEEENEFKLKENQERFFSAKRDHIQKCLEHEDSDSLAKTATFLLNQLEDARKANERLKARIKKINEQHQKEIDEIQEKLKKYKLRAFDFTGVMVSIYRLVDRHAGEEIRQILEKNDKTQKQGQIRALTEQLKKLA